MAILNEDALDAIYILIGNTAKKDADEKKEDYKLFLFVASYIAIPVGLFLLILVPGFGLFFVSDSYTHFGYYVPGIVVIILGIVFIIINVTKFNRKKKTDDFDSYAYGKEHFQEYISDETKKKNKSFDQIFLHEAIAFADNLVSAELLSGETGTKYVGKSRTPRTYEIYEYKLTYIDGTVKTERLRDDFYPYSIRIINYYLPSNSEERENN